MHDGLDVTVLTPAIKRDDHMILVHVAGGHVSLWQQVARNAARELFGLNPEEAKRLYDPGTRVGLQFDMQDFSEALKAAAIEAFNDEWRQLVPGWTDPRAPREQEPPRG